MAVITASAAILILLYAAFLWPFSEVQAWVNKDVKANI